MIYNKIRAEHLRSLQEQKSETKDALEASFSLKSINKLDASEDTLTPYEQVTLAFDQLTPSAFLTDKLEKNKHVLDVDAWQDLDLICGHESTPGRHILSVIDRTQTQVGRCVLATKIVTPSSDNQQVTHQQEIVKTLSQNHATRHALQASFKELKEDEGMRLGLWSKRSPLYHKSYIKSLKNNFRKLLGIFTLNPRSVTQLTFVKRFNDFTNFIFMPFIPIFIGLIFRLFFIFSYGISNMTYIMKGLLRGSASDLNLLFTPIGGFCLFTWAVGAYIYYRRTSALITFLTKHLVSLQTLFRVSKSIRQVIGQDPKLAKLYIRELAVLQAYLSTKKKAQSDGDQLIYLLKQRDYRKHNFFFTPLGGMLVAHHLFQDNKQVFADLIAILGTIDADCSTASLLTDKHPKNGYTLSSIAKAQSETFAAIHVDKAWHPLLNPQEAVPADLVLNSDHNRTKIITGPNMAGKSSYILANTVGIVLSQSLGIAPAKRFEHTLFNKIITYVNPTQNLAKGLSLAGASLMVLKKHATILETTKGPIFAAIDEIFNGVNYQTGLKIALVIIKERHEAYPNCLSMLTTHYEKIAQSMDAVPGVINNKVTVEVPDDIQQPIIYNYKIKPGISSQNDILIDIIKRRDILRKSTAKKIDGITRI